MKKFENLKEQEQVENMKYDEKKLGLILEEIEEYIEYVFKNRSKYSKNRFKYEGERI